MIFRKPYAFLIRKFKIIHLLLTLCSIYLVTRINGLLGFYNSFINGTVGKLAAENYFGNLYIYVVVVAIAICLIILMLMRYKKKSYLFYIVMIGYFLGIALVINYSCGGLYDIYISTVDTKTLLLYRDVLKIVNFIQYIFVFMLLVRGLGFDIKKFNFVDDLVELNEDITDDEEVELTLGGMEGTSRKFFRNIREFKYYYLENKHTINILFIIILVVGGLFYVINTKILNPVYKANDVLVDGNFSYKVIESYVTNIGYNNEKILNHDETFVLVKMSVTKNGAKDKINTANIMLNIEEKNYATENVSSKFSDLGFGYGSQLIDGTATYLFAYKISIDNLKKKMILTIGKERKIRLNPIYLDEVQNPERYKVGDTLSLTDTIYKDGELLIKSFEVKDKFNHSYTYEVLEQSYEGNISIYSVSNVIMNLKIKSNYTSGLNDYNFLNKYAELKYKIGDSEYVSKVFEDKTPGSYKDGLYVVVDKQIMKADSIWFDIVVRNKRYIYKLK